MQFLAMFGMTMYLPFLPLYVQRLGVVEVSAAASWSGVLFGVGFLFAGIMAPVWGHLADRWGRKRMLLRAAVGSGAVLCAMAFARNVQDLLLLRILHGSVGGFVAATTALAVTLVPENRVGHALGALQSASMAGLIVGPFVGGWLVDLWGFRPLILFAACLLFAGAAAVALGVTEDPSTLRPAGGPGLLDDFRFVFDSRHLASASGLQFMVQLSLMSVQPVLALFVMELGPAGGQVGRSTGLVIAATGFATLFGAFWLGRRSDRRGPVPVLQVCLLGAGLAYLPQAFVPGLTSLVLLRVVLGFFVGGIQPAAQSLITRGTPKSRRAGVLGITFAAGLFGNAVGPVLGGAVAALAGVRAPFLATAVLLLVAWLIARRAFRGVRSLPGPVEESSLA
jgi:MFS family permease